MGIFENNNLIVYLIAFVVAAMVAFVTVPLSKKIAFKLGAIAVPNERSMHKKPMPLAGGISIICGFIAALLVAMFIYKGFEYEKMFGFVTGAIIIACVGLLDDIYNLSAKVKLLFQILAALVAVYTGTRFDYLTWPWNPQGFIHLGDLGRVISVLWIIGVINAINFIDGLDGLAAGISSIASICLMLIAILTNNPPVVILTAALSGACLGFLPMNFNPAKIFMGDTGSTFLGFSLAVISIQGLLKSYTAITVIAALFVLGLPVFDTGFAILRRVINRKPIYVADRGHLHHRLVDRGFSQRRAVITLYMVSGGFGIAGILYAIGDIRLAIGILSLMFIVWLVDFIVSRLRKQSEVDVEKEIESK
jgi:UDP-GlcNAc:undecaprenyl-phosphate GlcNAc-1-phosphate transferase